MRSNVEQRRCGCGSIIGLRESCLVCTSRRRAELHAAGYCRSDGTGQPYDCGKPSPDVDALVDWAIGEARKLGLSGHEADAFINRQVASEVAGDAVRPPKPLPPWPIPAIGETCSYEVALRDMQARPEARYRCDVEGAGDNIYLIFMGGLCICEGRFRSSSTAEWVASGKPSCWTRVA
jgi:hypothetical protein